LTVSPDGHLIVVSGPSGAGKSSVLDAVLARTSSAFSISATTRPPRANEQDGREYHFMGRQEFERLIDAGDVLEWAEYGGHLYGTLRSEVLPLLSAGANVLLDIENEGAKQIRASFPSAVMIFIRPPSVDELERRLTARGDTSPNDIARRVSVAVTQIEEAPGLYDHIVLNDDLDTAIGRVLDILSSLSADPIRPDPPPT
jgi:guanylate kinase